jgi:hypothetical protein
MTRERLPNYRPCESFRVECAGLTYTATIARFGDGRLAEIFLTNHKQGSHANACARDSAVICSLGLQYGVPLDVIRGALLRNADGSASTPLGVALDAIAAFSSHGFEVETLLRDEFHDIQQKTLNEIRLHDE